jgi:hypothetical protein
VKFDELIDGDDLTPEEEARLRRVHELLVQAGPPPDLTPALEELTAPHVEEPIPFLLQRRRGLAAVLALAAALAAFAGGYAFGHSKTKPTAFATERVVPMHGTTQGALAVLKLGHEDGVGNWPMQIEVTGLPTQRSDAAYYELWLTRDGKPVAPCGSFRVNGKTTRVRLTIPYRLTRFDGWVVTAQPPRLRTPGRVVLST